MNQVLVQNGMATAAQMISCPARPRLRHLCADEKPQARYQVVHDRNEEQQLEQVYQDELPLVLEEKEGDGGSRGG